MANTNVVLLRNLVPTSSGALFTIGVGGLDDAQNLNLYFTSSANANTSAAVIQVSLFDPNLASSATPTGISVSTGYFNLSTAIATITSSGSHLSISPISFKGIRLSVTTSNAGEIIAYAAKQISV